MNFPVGQASVPAILKTAVKPMGLQIYRRKLPHWRLEESVYFLTWRLHRGQPELSPSERSAIVSALRYFNGQRYELFAFVVMPDHVHVLMKPHGFSLQNIVHSWKSFSANRLQREFGREKRIWQEEYYDRIMRDEAEFLEKANYIFNNPAKVWSESDEYPWVWVEGVAKAGTEARPTGTGTSSHSGTVT